MKKWSLSLDPPQIQFQFNEKDKVIKYRLFSRYHAFLEGKLVEISDEITPAELKGAVRVKSEFFKQILYSMLYSVIKISDLTPLSTISSTAAR